MTHDGDGTGELHTPHMNRKHASRHGETGADPVTLSGEQVELAEVGTATYDDLQDFLNNTMSSGYVTGGTCTDNGDGTVAVAAGKGYVRADASDISELRAFDFAADASVSLTDQSLNYVYVDYNAGTPSIAAVTDITTLDHTSQFVVALVYRNGTDIHIVQAGQKLNNLVHRLYYYLWEQHGIEHASGAVTSHTGTRNIAITAGVLYWAMQRVATAAFDSSGDDTFTYLYRGAPSGWVQGSASQIDNTQYDDGSGTLATLTANRYGVHWVHMVPDGDVYVTYGWGDYTLAQAQAATVPSSLEPEIANIGLLIAKIIIKKSASSFTEVLLPWTSSIGLSGASDHGGLAGLGDDDHPQYVAHTDYEYPQWTKYTITEADFTGITNTESKLLVALPAAGVIHAVKIKHSASWTGGGATSATISVGPVGSPAKYSTAFDVYQATGNTVQQITGTIGTENHAATTNINAALTVNLGATTGGLTAGSCDIWLLWSVAS